MTEFVLTFTHVNFMKLKFFTALMLLVNEVNMQSYWLVGVCALMSLAGWCVPCVAMKMGAMCCHVNGGPVLPRKWGPCVAKKMGAGNIRGIPLKAVREGNQYFPLKMEINIFP